MGSYQQVAIVGVGLLGGSIAKALKSRKLAQRIVGIGRSRERLENAVEAGIIDAGFTDGTEVLRDAELTVVCTPVHEVVNQVVEAARLISSSAWITDVASTKGEIVEAVESNLPQVPFIGSHPLAGDHRTGAAYSRADLYEGRTVVVTPTDRTSPQVTARAMEFWQSLGSRVEVLSPEEHDSSLAKTSHLPHLVAAALALATPESCDRLVASGWLDTTRIAAGDPALWRPIFASNRAQVVHAIERFRLQLEKLTDALCRQDDETLELMLAEGKRVRDALGS